MKKMKSILMIAALLCITTSVYAQEKRNMKVYYKSGNTLTVAVSEIDSIKFVVSEEGEEGVVINGIRWATRNVDMPGTFAAKPEDPGMFYQWNRKIGWSSTDPMVNSDGGTTWDDSEATGNTWEKPNDPCPTGWRVPTQSEHQSLADAGSQWTTINGVNGRIFGVGNNTLFLPAAGYRYYSNGTVNHEGAYGNYCSSSCGSTTSSYHLYIYNTLVSATNSSLTRAAGFSVRCIAEQ